MTFKQSLSVLISVLVCIFFNLTSVVWSEESNNTKAVEAGIIGTAAVDTEITGESEGGIIGTGIVGTITELGSIYVNGQHIKFTKTQNLTSPLGVRPAAELVPGETVIVEATANNGSWQAQKIRSYLPIIGPLHHVSLNRLSVMGTDILVTKDTDCIGFNNIRKLKPNDWIAVSGLWQGNRIIATRIEKIQAQPFATVLGTYRLSEDNMAFIGGTAIQNFTPQHAKPGDVLTVQGTGTTEGIEARDATIGLFSGPVLDVIIEGYMSQPGAQGAYTIFGSGLVAYMGPVSMAIPVDRGVYCVKAGEQANIRRVSNLPEDKTKRRRLLHDLYSGNQIACD
jgi:hypothetical protein